MLTAVAPAELVQLGDEILAEVEEMAYLYDRPLRLDSTRTEEVLGVTATPFEEVLEEIVRGARS